MTGRIIVLAFLLATATVMTGGCGCGDVRHSSSVSIELSSPLPAGEYDAVICVDDRCDTFTAVDAPGRANRDGGWESELVLESDSVLFVSWWGISAGDHRLKIELTNESEAVLGIDRMVTTSTFQCSGEDSRVEILH